jgi:Sec-independent protein translocase protein TatA
VTPEQAAQRVVREHQERHPNILRDIFYRIEQAVALFLASLIPGVGERHVAAREEARREVERVRLEAERAREEEEKKRQEEAEKAEAEQGTGEKEGAGGESSKTAEKEQLPAEGTASEPNVAAASQDGEARATFT